MAVIGRKRRPCLLLPLLFVLCTPLLADRASDVRAQVTYVASALANGNPTDALTPFDKSLADYDKLSRYFGALTGSFDVVSEIEIVDEDDAELETTLKVNWALQVSDRANNSSARHSYDVTMRLKSIKGKWQIVAFMPIEMFNPQSPATANR